MATNAIRLLTQQHRDVEKWFDELARLHTGRHLAEGWPHEGAAVRAATDSGEEIRESAEAGLHIAGPEAVTAAVQKGLGIPPESERSRTATPPPSEADGRSDDAVPGQEFRDLAGHHPDGKTHVGMDDERVRAQMVDAATGKPRAESMIGQGRENLAGVREQFDNPAMVQATGGRVGMHAATGGEPGAADLDLRARTRRRVSSQRPLPPREPLPETWAETPAMAEPLDTEPLARGASIRNADLRLRKDGPGSPTMNDAPHAHAQPQTHGGLRTAGGAAQVAGGSSAENVGAHATPGVGKAPPWAEAAEDPGEVALSEHELDHKRALSVRLFDTLTAHTVLEEQLLYPAARATVPHLVEASIEAHREMKDVMTELRHTDAALARFDHLLEHLHRTFADHIREEETHLLPGLDEALGTARLEELGAHMQERFRALLGLERRFSVQGVEGVAMLAPPAVPLGHLDEVEALEGTDDEAEHHNG